jgi:phosphotransferase system enzyme I (PtsI)
MTLALSGHKVESGIAVGQTHVIQHNELEIGEFRITAGQVDKEIERLNQALSVARDHLGSLGRKLRTISGPAAEEIITTHIHMLQDSSLVEATAREIRQQLCNAEWALQLRLESLLAQFREIDDEYIRSREDDTVQVVRMVQQFLSQEESERPLSGVPDRLGHTIVIAGELTPGELAILHERGVAGVITEHGSPYSHTAILARSLAIPTVMGVRCAQSLVKEGEQLILDGHYGIVFADPEESILKHYIKKQAESHRFRKSLEAVRERPPVSLDRLEISLLANAEKPADMRAAVEDGAAGVGLFRSEFLLLQGVPPDEESQLAHYREALEALDGASLTIRTLDIGADKTVDLLDFGKLRSNPNPALGLRAVRLCLREMELFHTQLRAILRASALGPVRCLIPMLTSAREVLAVRTLLDEIMVEMKQAGEAFDSAMPLGGMIEVPGTALALEQVCGQLDFVSIGTNDLIQYTLAADRLDEHVAHLYDPEHPGVLQILTQAMNAAQRLELPLAVCGELAGDRRYTRMLLALGLREFSMQPRYLLEVKKVISETDIGRASAAVQEWQESGGIEGFTSLVNYLDHTQVHHSL